MITFGYICYAVAIVGFAYGFLGIIRAAMSRKGHRN